MTSLLLATRKCVTLRPLILKGWIVSWLVSYQRKSTNISAVDSFINELVDNKKLKWKVLNSRHRNGVLKAAPLESPANNQTTETFSRSSFRLSDLYNELTNNPLVVNISQMEVAQVDHLVETALNERNTADIQLLLAQILEYRKLPSLPTLNSILTHLSQQGDTDRLDQLIELCCSLLPEPTGQPIGRFEHYRALCQWKLGNTSKSLETFRSIMVSGSADQLMPVNQMLKEIIDETIGKKSEAVLLAVMKLGEFCLNNLNQEFPICYVWEKSFLSPWHSDQEAAKMLFDSHEMLREAVSKRIPKLCYKSLYDNNVEKVYQLIELFLKHNMKPECKSIMIRLFEYQYWRKNLRGCSEIMQNAIDLNISLPDMCNRQLLELLLGRTMGASDVVPLDSKKEKELKPTKYVLKF
ncbi:uncharacterized protein LOC128725977 [Anopheles nili]|uniref:uncharacterized protein LOC128725977 n=1 Tax=Anopheles nili TaxID=185578 RepID=UPI00237A1581|nr:uncharacterized protein LOC128725977 [Anopheles nili]